MDATRLVAVIICCWLFKRISGSSIHQECYRTPSQIDENLNSTTVDLKSKQLQEVPPGNYFVIGAYLGYNLIEKLPACAFFRNSYQQLQNLELGHNRISYIHPEAFKATYYLKEVDLSYNNITILDPNTFKYNYQLEKIDVAFNQVTFEEKKPFLRSSSLKKLILTKNEIDHVYDITFSKLPNLESLLLNNNEMLSDLSRRCFAHLEHLQYLSLAGTQVFNLGTTMFHTNLPKLVDISATNLAQKFSPPLSNIKKQQLVKLMTTEEEFSGDGDYSEIFDGD